MFEQRSKSLFFYKFDESIKDFFEKETKKIDLLKSIAQTSKKNISKTLLFSNISSGLIQYANGKKNKQKIAETRKLFAQSDSKRKQANKILEKTIKRFYKITSFIALF